MAEVGLFQPGTGVPSERRRARPQTGDTGGADAGEPAHANGRRITRSRSLPGPRAVVGGLLVALAVLGTFVAAHGSSGNAGRPTVVAAHDLAAGTKLTAGDLRVVVVDLPAAQARVTFADPRRLAGVTLLAPVAQGELVQSGIVAVRPTTGQQVSFPIDASRALGGALRPGEHVDVLATYGGDGADSYTVAVAQDVAVAEIRGAGTGAFVEGNRSLVLTVTLADPAQVLAVTHAARGGALTVVRAAPGGYADPVYRPSAQRRTGP